MAIAKNIKKTKKSDLRSVVDFVIRKFLIRTNTIKKETKILEKQIINLREQQYKAEQEGKINRMKHIINKTKQIYD